MSCKMTRIDQSKRFSSIEYKRDYEDGRSVYEIDREESDLCLNCTKEKCNGNCKKIKEYLRTKNAKK